MTIWADEILPYADRAKIFKCREFNCVIDRLSETGRFSESFLQKESKDSWGNDLRFVITSAGEIEITSSGPNGIYDVASPVDDLKIIVTWKDGRPTNQWIAR